MAVSQVELCNLALSRSGGQRITQITSLGEASNEARQCAVKLPHLIRIALRAFPWRFATRKKTLAPIVYEKNSLTSTVFAAAIMDYSLANGVVSSQENAVNSSLEQVALYGSSVLYQYPEDCLAARMVYSVKSHASSSFAHDCMFEGNGRDFAVELGSDGTKCIITDINDAVLIYTYHASEPSVWDALFYDALAWQLAAELCISLGNDVQKAQSLESKASLAWDKAKSMDSKEQSLPSFASSYLFSRY